MQIEFPSVKRCSPCFHHFVVDYCRKEVDTSWIELDWFVGHTNVDGRRPYSVFDNFIFLFNGNDHFKEHNIEMKSGAFIKPVRRDEKNVGM